MRSRFRCRSGNRFEREVELGSRIGTLVGKRSTWRLRGAFEGGATATANNERGGNEAGLTHDNNSSCPRHLLAVNFPGKSFKLFGVRSTSRTISLFFPIRLIQRPTAGSTSGSQRFAVNTAALIAIASNSSSNARIPRRAIWSNSRKHARGQGHNPFLFLRVTFGPLRELTKLV